MSAYYANCLLHSVQTIVIEGNIRREKKTRYFLLSLKRKAIGDSIGFHYTYVANRAAYIFSGFLC